MATSYKAESIAKDLADKLTSRQPFAAGATLAVTLSYDTDLNPLITVGPGTNGSRTAVIKVMPESWTNAKDSLGNTAQQYAPTVIMIAKEANYVGTNDNIADPLKEYDLLFLYGACAAYGTKLELWTSTAGTAPSASTFGTASNRIAEFYPQHYRPLQSQS